MVKDVRFLSEDISFWANPYTVQFYIAWCIMTLTIKKIFQQIPRTFLKPPPPSPPSFDLAAAAALNQFKKFKLVCNAEPLQFRQSKHNIAFPLWLLCNSLLEHFIFTFTKREKKKLCPEFQKYKARKFMDLLCIYKMFYW